MYRPATRDTAVSDTLCLPLRRRTVNPAHDDNTGTVRLPAACTERLQMFSTVRGNDPDTTYPAFLEHLWNDFIHFSFREILERTAAKRNTPG
jgi:hypothetical protein